MLRRLLRATRLDLVAAFVSNGPSRGFIWPFIRCGASLTTVIVLRIDLHCLSLIPVVGRVVYRGFRTRRRGDECC